MRVFLLGVLILSPVLASAQSIEVFATTGVVQLWDDEGSLGVGVPIGGGVGFKSPHGWGIEMLAETQKAQRNFDSGVQFDSTVTAARGRIIKYFGSGRTQPYAGGGLGVTRVKSTRESPTGCALVNNVFTARAATSSGANPRRARSADSRACASPRATCCSCGPSSSCRGRASTCASAGRSPSGRHGRVFA